MIDIIPALLEKSPQDLEEKLASLPSEARLVHLDVIEEDVWVDIDRDFEVHLMVREPAELLDTWVERGAKRVIAHALLDTQSLPVEFGLAVELETPLEEVLTVADKLDFIQLMSIREVGAQGRPFEPEIFDRIREVREKFPDLTISVDGGVNISNYEGLVSAGANRLVVGSGFQELWSSITNGRN